MKYFFRFNNRLLEFNTGAEVYSYAHRAKLAKLLLEMNKSSNISALVESAITDNDFIDVTSNEKKLSESEENTSIVFQIIDSKVYTGSFTPGELASIDSIYVLYCTRTCVKMYYGSNDTRILDVIESFKTMSSIAQIPDYKRCYNNNWELKDT